MQPSMTKALLLVLVSLVLLSSLAIATDQVGSNLCFSCGNLSSSVASQRCTNFYVEDSRWLHASCTNGTSSTLTNLQPNVVDLDSVIGCLDEAGYKCGDGFITNCPYSLECPILRGEVVSNPGECLKLRIWTTCRPLLQEGVDFYLDGCIYYAPTGKLLPCSYKPS